MLLIKYIPGAILPLIPSFPAPIPQIPLGKKSGLDVNKIKTLSGFCV
jgi:hypothetical protein